METLTATIHASPNDAYLYLYHSTGQMEGNDLSFRLRGWCFNNDSHIRRIFFDKLLDFYRVRFNIAKGSPQYQNYLNRTKYFPTDSLANINIALNFTDGKSTAPYYSITDYYGYFYIDIKCKVTTPATRYMMKVYFGSTLMNVRIQVPSIKPINVISDIDDTIKDSNVLDKIELMHNTLYRDFKVVPYMNTLYNSLKNLYNFHYVSASPVQLYEPLYQFLDRYGFPTPENISLKKLKASDPFSASVFLDNTREYKIGAIQSILERNTGDFILIGDSGEMDPEIYTVIADQFPDRIKAIYIRMVTKEDVYTRFPDRLRDKVRGFSDGISLRDLIQY